MKKIGTSEQGIIVEVTQEEYQMQQGIDYQQLKVLLTMVNDLHATLSLLWSKVETAAPGKQRRSKPVGPKPRKVRASADKTGAQRKKGLLDFAVEILRESSTPLTLGVIVDRMKAKGCTFRSSNPVASISTMFAQKKAASIVGTVGRENLYAVPGSRTKESLTPGEKLVVNADPAQLTADAKERRKALLIQLNEKAAGRSA